MIGRIYSRLRGPVPIRVGTLVLLAALALLALLFLYEWVGTTFIDPTMG